MPLDINLRTTTPGDRDEKIIAAIEATQAGLLKATTPKLVEGAGSPVYDTRVVGRIWALFPTIAAGFEGNWNDIVKYSDDWGDTWVEWTTFAPFPKPTNNTTMAMDSLGNIYILRSNGVVSRIDNTTKAVTDVITLFPTGGVWNFYNWNFTEDRTGRVYISGYKVAVGSHYLWVSPAGGTAFVRKDFLVTKYPLDSHFHSFKVNPYTGKLWITWGDSAVKSLVAVSTGTDGTILATDNFDAEFTVVPGNASEFGAQWPKPTDITPTNETVYMADDRPGSANYITNVQNNEVRRVYKHETPFSLLAGYYIKSCGDNEFWVSAYDELNSPSQTATLCKFKKDPGVDSYLRLVATYQLDDPNTTGW